MRKKTVIINASGRGLALAYRKSFHLGKIVIIPGNDLVCDVSLKSLALYLQIKTADVQEIFSICKKEKADSTVVENKADIIKISKKMFVEKIDKIHMPYSSRFWITQLYKIRLAKGQDPGSFDKNSWVYAM